MIHYVLILAAGKGLRLKNSKTPKQFLELNNLPIVMHSALAFKKADPNSEIYIALPKDYIDEWRIICKQYNFHIPHKVYVGGARRIETVSIGLHEVNRDIKNKNSEYVDIYNSSKKALISIHDGARPFIDSEFIIELISSAKKHHSAIPVIKLKNSLRKFQTDKKIISESRFRSDYILTQTPQVFLFSDIYNAYLKITQLGKDNHDNRFFDDASVFDFSNKNKSINTIDGKVYNIKITNDLDYTLAPSIYKYVQELACRN